MPVTSSEQRGVLALQVNRRTMLANAARSLAAAFGLVAPQGVGKLAELVAQIQAEPDVPDAPRQAVWALYGQVRAVRESAAELEAVRVARVRMRQHAGLARGPEGPPQRGPVAGRRSRRCRSSARDLAARR